MLGRLFFTLGTPLNALGLPLGALGQPFDVLGLPFFALGSPFGTLARSFGAHGFPFGALWRSFDALGRPFFSLGFLPYALSVHHFVRSDRRFSLSRHVDTLRFDKFAPGEGIFSGSAVAHSSSIA